MTRLGGSFAPPLTDDLIDEYEDRIDGLSSRLPHKDMLQSMINCCREWWKLPEANGTPTRPHPVHAGMSVVDLQLDHQKVLWDHIPWDHEIKAMQELCDGLASGVSESEIEEKEVPFCHVDETGHVLEEGVTKVPCPRVTDPEAKALRDMAFHLLWHVIELSKDREPLTADKLVRR